jgi:CheY-like chemotaxis protein
MPHHSIRETTKSSIPGLESALVAQSNTVLSGKRCLVLEDELLIGLDIEQILEAAGATSVTCVGSADEALAAIRGGARFDVAVLDVVLRGATRTSLSVAAALQLQKTPFVFLTGMRGAELEAKEFPKAPLVEKPYQPPLLVDAIMRALAAR